MQEGVRDVGPAWSRTERMTATDGMQMGGKWRQQ